MKNTFKTSLVLAIAGLLCGFAFASTEDTKKGDALFKQYCAVCHAGGGNTVNPQKTLHKKAREANGVKTASDIVSKMRTPGPGMTKFDAKTIPDKDANDIAAYILKTF